MTGVVHRTVESNGIRIHLAERGVGPLVLLCHGFPEGWYSWRHQLEALAAAGYRAVAPDMRGYGNTEIPCDVGSFTVLHHVGDMVGVVNALGYDHAVIVGHDWGAPVAWTAALSRPDVFRAVAALSVPFSRRPTDPPTTLMPITDKSMWYALYFQSPGVAEVELERDVRSSLRSMLASGFGESQPSDELLMVSAEYGLLAGMRHLAPLPLWLEEKDLDYFTEQFSKTGFVGGLNWYRNMDRNWELLADFAETQIKVPALFIYGDRDVVARFPGMSAVIDTLSDRVPGLRRALRLTNCGHWTQQEKPAEVNKALIDFLDELQS